MKIAVDTNVLIYAHDQRDPVRQATCLGLLNGLSQDPRRMLALQVVGEFFAAATRKLGMKLPLADQLCQGLLAVFPTYSFGPSNVSRALSAAGSGILSYWDGLLLSSSLDAGCEVFISEDMQSGFKFGAMEIISPFDASGGLSQKLKQRLGSP